VDKIFCVGDLHCPFVAKDKVTKMLDLASELKPDHIVILGDSYDMYSFSKFPRNMNLMTPNEEVMTARMCMEEIWGALKRRCKKAKIYQLKGNHCDRVHKRLVEKFPEFEPFMNINHLWEYPGVQTIHDSSQELEIDDVVFIHGFRSKIGDHMKNMLRNICAGHLHRGGVVYQRIAGKTLFELNAGYLADPFHPALRYRATKNYFDWTHGVGFIDKNGARFIPL